MAKKKQDEVLVTDTMASETDVVSADTENKYLYGMIPADWSDVRVGEIEAEINFIRRQTATQMLMSSVQIGGLLVEAKERLSHGGWSAWLKDNFSYSQTTANKLMRLYENYGRTDEIEGTDPMEIFGSLSPSQAFALLPLSSDERREFVESHDMDETSVRQIDEEVRARKAAERALDDAHAENAEQKKIIEAQRGELEAVRGKIGKAQEKIDALRASSSPDNAAIQSAVDAALASHKREADKALKQASAAERAALKRADEAERALSDAKGELDRVRAGQNEETDRVIGEIREEEARKREALEARYKSMTSTSLQRFSVLFDLVQTNLEQMQSLFPAVCADVPEKAEILCETVNSTIQGFFLQPVDKSD